MASEDKVLAGALGGLLLLFFAIVGGLFYSVSLDAETARACIEQGHEWLEGNCVKLSRD